MDVEEPSWLVNTIIAVSVLPIVVGVGAEHLDTESFLTLLSMVVYFVAAYTVFGGRMVDHRQPKDPRKPK